MIVILAIDIDLQAQESINLAANIGNKNQGAGSSKRRRGRRGRGRGGKGKKKEEIKIDFTEIDAEMEDFVTLKAPFYNPIGKLDPFEPSLVEIDPDAEPDPTFFDLDSFKVLGIFWSKSFIKAIVVGPPPLNKGFIILEGDLIGKNNGKVHKILKETVIVRESIKGPDEKTYFIDHKLALVKGAKGAFK